MRQKYLYSSSLLFHHFGCGMQLCSRHTMFLHHRVHLLARLSRKKKLGHVACVRNICMQMHFCVYGVLYVFLASVISAVWKYQNFDVILYIKIWYFHTNSVEITHIGVEISFLFFLFLMSVFMVFCKHMVNHMGHSSKWCVSFFTWWC